MSNIIKRLEKTDHEFLENNYAIDADYFELETLPVSPFKPKR